MYTPSSFQVNDTTAVHSFIRSNGFGIIISREAGTLEDTHTPMYLSEDGAFLCGHLARANAQWRQWSLEPRVKIIFHGPHAYISPRFYQSAFNVPTWNYTAVSVNGRIEIVSDREEEKEILRRLIFQYEADAEAPWALDESDERLLKLFDAIVFFRVRIESLEAKFKLNQNKSEEDQASVVRHLRLRGGSMDEEVADLMAKNLPASP